LVLRYGEGNGRYRVEVEGKFLGEVTSRMLCGILKFVLCCWQLTMLKLKCDWKLKTQKQSNTFG
jgi:hypothetical protein